MPVQIAITGATGFIGTALCRQLSQLHQLKALVRKPQEAPELRSLGVELIAGSLASKDSLEQLVDGADIVIHCAGSVRGTSLEDFRPANVYGCHKLASVLAEHNPNARLLAFSSLSTRESLSWYATSKLEGEQILEQSAFKNWTILRPPAVYGPGDKEMLPLLKLMAKGVAIIPGSPEARVSLIYIEDLVKAVSCWIASRIEPGQTFTLCDPEEQGYSWRQIARITGQRCGRNVKLLQVPRWLLDSFATINLYASRIFNYAPILNPSKLQDLRHADWVCQHSAFSEATGWQPETDFPKGLELTLGL